MTVDLATLGLAVDSKDVVRANDNLDDLAKTAGRTERATKGFEGEAKKATKATDGMGKAAGRTNGILARLGINARGVATAFTGILGAMGVSAGFAQATRSALDFDSALREVSTLFPVLAGQTDEVESAARRLGLAYGTSATQQVQAFYQAISAGASSVSQATEILDTANRVAIGGVTDVTTAVDVLTTATNAYAATGLTAAEAGDALFVGMRAGKTTIEELASSLGNVIPIAASLGVSFDEVVAATAALTTQGQSTAQAVTGVRAILAAVARPTDRAANAAKDLGIEFNTTALRAKGLEGFLADIIEKTGGSADKMAQLFGSVEALNAALSMAGGGGAAFSGILADMEDKAGSVDEAFNRVAQGLQQRLNVVLAAIGDRLMRVGTVILGALIPAFELLINHGTTIERVLITIGAGMAVAFGPQIVAMVTTLAIAIGTRLLGAVNAVTAALLRNPFGALAVAITMLIVAAYQYRDEIGRIFGVELPEMARVAGNKIIGLFRGTFNVMVEIFKGLPEVVGSAAIQAMNRVIEAIERMIAKAVEQINTLIAPLNWLLGQAGMEGFGSLTTPSLGQITDPFEGALARTFANASGRFSEAMSTEYIAPFQRAEEATRTATDALEEFNTATQSANDNLPGLGMSLADVDAGGRGAAGSLREMADASDEAASRGGELAQTLAGQFSNMFTGLINGTMDARQAITQLLQSLSRLLINRAFQALFGGTGGGLFGGGFADGAAFSGGNVIPFARGGVVNGPTMFPMAGRRTGLMGEAGPEAIMPLSRGSDGKLGVRAQGGGGNTVSVVNHINIERNGTQGNEANDRDLAHMIGQAVETRVKKVMMQEARVGGALNPVL